MIDWGRFIAEIIVAFVGTISFGILFHVSRRNLFYGGLTGAIAWLTYLVVLMFSKSELVATFVAATSLAGIARFLSVKRKSPTTTFLVCGIFTLVPGTKVYYMAYTLSLNDAQQGFSHGYDAIKLALAISVGIAVAYSIPSSFFGWENNHNK